jgi:hypothetical protein
MPLISLLLPADLAGSTMGDDIGDVGGGGGSCTTPHGRDRSGMLPALIVAGCPCGVTSGNTITLFRTHPGATLFPRVMILGPDYPCLCMTFAIIIGAWLAFLILLGPRLHAAVTACGVLVFLTTLAALMVTAFSDPGIVPKRSHHALEKQQRAFEAAVEASRQASAAAAAGTGAEAVPGLATAGAPQTAVGVADYGTLPYGFSMDTSYSGLVDAAGSPIPDLTRLSVCSMCNVYREGGTAHCYDCNACVLQLDHHCPWTGKCIGKHNLRPFYAFLWSISVSILFVSITVFAHLLQTVARVG